MCNNIASPSYTTKILLWKQNLFWFFSAGEPFPILSIVLHLWLTNTRCVAVVQLSLFNSGYLLLKEQISYPPTISPLNITENWPTIKAANGLNWLSLDHRKTKAGTKEEASGTEKGDPLIPLLAS